MGGIRGIRSKTGCRFLPLPKRAPRVLAIIALRIRRLSSRLFILGVEWRKRKSRNGGTTASGAVHALRWLVT